MVRELHPDMQIIIEAAEQTTDELGGHEEAPDEARRWWGRYTARLNQPPPADMEISDRTIPTAERAVPVRVYRPAGPAGPRPGILYLHGGGFMLGDLDSSDSNAWGFAQQTGAVVVSVDYRLTPEHPYPAAFNDGYGVLQWLAENPDALGIRADRIAIAGDSAGGKLSAALSLAARDRGGPTIVAQALVYASTEPDERLPSYVENADGLGLTTAQVRHFRDLYLPSNRDSMDPYASPALASDYSLLPPALVHTAEFDPVRDDGRAYASKLALAGNWVTYREARGMIHGFMRARFTGAAARAEFDAICDFLRTHLTC